MSTKHFVQGLVTGCQAKAGGGIALESLNKAPANLAKGKHDFSQFRACPA